MQTQAIAVTGQSGFLGWHTRAALHSMGRAPISSVGSTDSLENQIQGSNRVIHLAGVNRGEPKEIFDGNINSAKSLIDALRKQPAMPEHLVFANSIQSGNGTPYGDSKAEAASLLQDAADDLGIRFLDVRLPNLFGQFGRPNYNSVTSTICHNLTHGVQTHITNNNELTLLHAQDAAEILITATDEVIPQEKTNFISLESLEYRIRNMWNSYQGGQIPDLTEKFNLDLFNTLRSYVPSRNLKKDLGQKSDSRGTFAEIVKSPLCGGQSSYSTTVKGATRGNHYHRSKVERFTVISGNATIRLRKIFTNEVVEHKVDGENPTSIDMPTFWCHSIVNSGTSTLITHFWTNEVFDPKNPDTYYEEV